MSSGRKLTIKEVERRFPDLVKGQVWRGSHAKYRFICLTHGKYLQEYAAHQQGESCPKCAHAASGRAQQLTVREAEKRCPDMVKGQVWTNAAAKYWFACSTHGEYKQSYNSHQQGHGCPKCSYAATAERERLTIQEMEKQCPDMVKGQVWAGNAAKYWFTCLTHGEYPQEYSSHQKGASCKKCANAVAGKALRLTAEEAERRCPDMVRGQVWVRALAKYQFICLTHGVYLQTYSGHQEGRSCPKCSNNAPPTIEEAERRCLDMVKGQVWAGTLAKYRFVCLTHGEYLQGYGNHQRGATCSKCADAAVGRAKRLTIQWMEEQCPDMVKGQVWASCKAKYRFICLTHGEYSQLYHGHRGGNSCPKCRASHGERKIASWLSGVEGCETFEPQKRFNTCRHKNTLPFDFGSESFRVLIEYHGEQHYHHGGRFRGGHRITRADVKDLQHRDRIKRNWARRNGYRLIVIPYTVKNIPGYLEKRLGKILPTALPLAA